MLPSSAEMIDMPRPESSTFRHNVSGRRIGGPVSLDGCEVGDLSDTELLAWLLGGMRGGESLKYAEEILSATGGLENLLTRPSSDLARFRGLGLARRARLAAALEIGRRYLEAPAVRTRRLKGPDDAARCFKARIGDLPHEVFGCLFLNTRNRIICFELLFRGTVDGASVYPREVLKRALHHNAAAIIAGHNHPSGDCEPSEADRSITVRLRDALALVDIRLLDHLIVSRHAHVSLAERGWL
jgi:DNA repair protein RadC